jgi:hypothetical protein
MEQLLMRELLRELRITARQLMGIGLLLLVPISLLIAGLFAAIHFVSKFW